MESLSADALHGIVEAYVLREGTDYGHRDYSLAEKCRAVKRQLHEGRAEIRFDPETGSVDIRPMGGN
ncbi:MAG: YheU family protein [Pseudomonadota bacterium]